MSSSEAPSCGLQVRRRHIAAKAPVRVSTSANSSSFGRDSFRTFDAAVHKFFLGQLHLVLLCDQQRSCCLETLVGSLAQLGLWTRGLSGEKYGGSSRCFVVYLGVPPPFSPSLKLRYKFTSLHESSPRIGDHHGTHEDRCKPSGVKYQYWSAQVKSFLALQCWSRAGTCLEMARKDTIQSIST